jgi:ABC-2 type transport system permease protein
MRRLLWIARHEYVRHARRKGFLLAAFGLPLLVAVGIALLILVLVNTLRPEAALGYVDPAGILDGVTLPAPQADEAPPVPLLAFADEAAARAALAAQQIDAYALIPPDYSERGELNVYGTESLSGRGRRTLEEALERGLLARAAVSPAVADRAREPLGEVAARTPEGAPLDPLLQVGRSVVALFGSLLFVVTVFSASGYLLQALVEEKENRTMEIVTTSVAPWQLIGGKTLGLGLLGLTIAVIWLVTVAIGWTAAGAFFAPVREIPLPLSMLAPAALMLPLGFLLFAGVMVAISAVVTTPQEGQQFAGIATVSAFLPVMLSALFFIDPNGPIPTTLSLFPFSAPVAMQLRLVAGDVPLWQLALSVALLALAAALAIWCAARVFRAGMLSYGKRLSLRETWRALRAG